MKRKIHIRKNEPLKRICVFTACAVREEGMDHPLKDPDKIFKMLKSEAIVSVKNEFTYSKIVSKEEAMESNGTIIAARVFFTRQNGYYLYGKDLLLKKKNYWVQYNKKTDTISRWPRGVDFIPDMKYGYTAYPSGEIRVITEAEKIDVMYFEI